MSAYYRPVILNAFPESVWSEIRKWTLHGIGLADALFPTIPFLNWPVGRDQRGDLRRAGVMWAIHDACTAQKLPFSSRTRENTVKNCHHIEVISQNVYIHVTRTNSMQSMPRDTVLRNNERLSNQGDLFDCAPFTTDLTMVKQFYGWLTFNADPKGQLTHLALGLPAAEKNEWLDIVSLADSAGAQFAVPGDEPRPPGPDQMMKFKAAVQKLLEPPSEENGEANEEV